MQWPLVLAALAMGAATAPHCTLMCAAPCTALTRGKPRATLGFHAGRLLSYMAAGAIAASSVEALGLWSRSAPALRPLWVMLHLAFLALGLWWLLTGRQPIGGARQVRTQVHWVRRSNQMGGATLAGLIWAAWPCATLQGALLLSALANDPLSGALVMGVFGLASAPGLVMGPWVWSRFSSHIGWAAKDGASSVGLKAAGLGMALASLWALTHDIASRWVTWCLA
jgi:sulfite exporter TauE/SafE